MGRKYEDCHKVVNNVIQKQCLECRNWLDMNTTNFNVANRNNDKFNERCKKCTRIKNRESYSRNRDKRLHEAKEYFLKNRDKQNAQKLVYYQQNKEKFHENHKEYCENNLEKVKADERKWRQDNPEKCREYSKNHRDHDMTPKEWRKNQEAFDNCCAYCGKTKEKQLEQNKEQFHKDHIVHDGYNDVRNSAPSCTQCNTSKHQYSIEEWYFQQSFFSQERLDKIYWWMTEGFKNVIENKPPYRIKRKRREGLTTYYYQLWSVDEKRNMISIINIGDKKKDILNYIEQNNL